VIDVTQESISIQQYIEALEKEGYAVSKCEEPPPPPPAKKKIRLLYYGDSPSVATGFGKVSSNILPRLWETGDYEIMCFGVNYWGIPHNYPFQIYPMLPNPQNDPYGRDKVMNVIPNLDFDVGFFLQDSFIMTFLPELIKKTAANGKKFRTLSYFPIDGVPWKEWIEAMSSTDMSVTYTEWGKKECIKAFPGIESKLQVVPHGISLKEFRPHPPERRAQLRQMLFGPHADKFIVINVNRNQQRKDLPSSLMAFREFKKECPNSVMYFHCAEQDVGWNMPRVATHLGLKPGEEVLFPKEFNVNIGFPVEWVNDLYNCADACISSAVGEGWGLSITESFATKTPFIGPDNTSLSEIGAEGRAFLCRSGDTPNMWQVYTMDNDVIRPKININDMVKYLKRLYDDKNSGGRLKHQVTEKAFKWTIENLQWERHIVPRFDAMFRALHEDLQRPGSMQGLPRVAGPAAGWKRGELV
jgi:glycosyltransferase involved in cell wall biosynthesis